MYVRDTSLERFFSLWRLYVHIYMKPRSSSKYGVLHPTILSIYVLRNGLIEFLYFATPL